MVEIIYNDANAGMMKTENLIRLPKNIRQIGIVSEKTKIYTEDYVISYLNQHFDSHNQISFILFGKIVTAKDKRYIFIDGAVSVETEKIFHRDTEINSEEWDKLKIASKEYFTDLEMVGWAGNEDSESAEDIHRRFFQESSRIYIRLGEGETDYYLIDQGSMQHQEGYYIYYARNEAMQNYMVEQQNTEQFGAEDLRDERTIEQFRQIMKERKEIVKHGRMMTVLSCASSCLALLVLAIGITMVNNYEKMQAMEVAIVELSTSLEEEDTAGQIAEVPKETVKSEPDKVIVQETLPETPKTEEPQPDTEPVWSQTTEVAAKEQTYVVKKGDTLMRISMEHYQTQDMVDAICELNQIDNKDIILCGQKILLP